MYNQTQICDRGIHAMPIHDWTRVEAGIFHDFHHEWISTIRRALNDGRLPPDYYALVEKQAGGFGPKMLTRQHTKRDVGDKPPVGGADDGMGELLVKKSAVVVRHSDRIAAVVEILSPENKGSRYAIKSVVDKAWALLEHKIHLLILDLFPPTKCDPNGFHAALWKEITDESCEWPADKRLTLAAYESALPVTAYVEPVAVGDALADMPLFLEPGRYVPMPLEATYQAAFSAVPLRWRKVLTA
jgi:hypothetical protein